MSDNPGQEKDYELINAYESTVMVAVKGLINKDPDMCKCEKCFLDTCAIVFNSGFSRFVTTQKGELLAVLPHMAENRDVELMVAALKAIELVKKHPIH